jgi:RNA polymerase sigma factor (sigma-70 family)
MTNSGATALLDMLVTSYDELKRRLTRRFGSEDFASEVLHETYLQLGRRSPSGAVKSPAAYLFRTALNVARDQQIGEARRLTYSEIEALTYFPDEPLDAARAMEARSELRLVEEAINELTPRRRAILTAVRLDGVRHAEVARELGISERLVDMELRAAIEHCTRRLKGRPKKSFWFALAKPSRC